GMGLVERHIRGARHKAAPLPAVVDGSEAAFAALPDELRHADVACRPGAAPLGARLLAALRDSGGALLAVAGDVAIDQRLYGELRRRRGNWIATDEGGEVALLRLEDEAVLAALAEVADWPTLIDTLLRRPDMNRLRQQDFTAHIAVL